MYLGESAWTVDLVTTSVLLLIRLMLKLLIAQNDDEAGSSVYTLSRCLQLHEGMFDWMNKTHAKFHWVSQYTCTVFYYLSHSYSI